MTNLNIFKDNTKIDLKKLLETRMLFLANSGGGKSYAFRKFLEEVGNQVMVLIIDVEGEYKTLREKFDYLLIGGDGDIPLNMKSAPLLPKKLFELKVSTIIDISELKSSDRIMYVKKFLEALMELPKKYWLPCIVGIEETHKLCGQQDKHDSGPAVIDLFTRGRKRGFCLHPNTKIITIKGMKKIKDIQKGDLVLTHKGRFKRVTEVFKRKYKGKLIGIKTFGGFSSCFTTPKHKYLCHITKNTVYSSIVENKEKWIEANRLNHIKKISKRIFSPKIVQNKDIKSLNIKYWKNKRIRKTKIKDRAYREISLPLNYPLLRIIGAFLAEGNYIRRQHQREKKLSGIVFNFGKSQSEIKFANEIKTQLAVMGYHSSLKKNKSGCNILRLRKREIAELFIKYFGEYSYNKLIPFNFLLLPKRKLKVLIDYYLKGDGYKLNQTTHVLSTTSKRLAEFVFLAGQKLNYSSSIQKDKRKNNHYLIQGRLINQKDIYQVYLRRTSNLRTSKFVGNKLCKSIKEIKSVFWKGFVYNLQIEEDESYCSLNQIIHNCGVAITQRIAKLHKDVAAECNNVFAGRMWLPNDIKTAAPLLGMGVKEAMDLLRNLQPGEWYCFGPAINKQVHKGMISEVKTTHPKIGIDLKEVISPPTAKIKNLISQLKELPVIADKELKEKADLIKKVTQLEFELKKAQKVNPTEVQVQSNCRSEQAKIKQLLYKTQSYRSYITQINKQQSEFRQALSTHTKRDKIANDTISTLEKMLPLLQQLMVIQHNIKMIYSRWTKTDPVSNALLDKMRSKEGLGLPATVKIKPTGIVTIKDVPLKPEFKKEPTEDNVQTWETEKLSPAWQNMLDWICAFHPKRITKQKLSFLTGTPIGVSTFRNGLSRLKTLGYITPLNNAILATDEGLKNIKEKYEIPDDHQQFLNMWYEKLSPAWARLLKVIVEKYPQEINKEDLSLESEVNIETSTFRNGLSRLNTLELIEIKGNSIKARTELFEEE